MDARENGTVLQFDIERGFGFIVPDADISQVVFAHKKNVVGDMLCEGDHVTYTFEPIGSVAVNITGGTRSSSTHEPCTPPRSQSSCVTPRAPRKRRRDEAA